MEKAVKAVENAMEPFIKEGKKCSGTFVLWNDYLDMIGLLLNFIRAERDGNWPLHLDCTAGMIPHMCAFDRLNYFRWLLIYLIDMYLLPIKAPAVHSEFMAGHHAISRSGDPFSWVWTDMDLEQSINNYSKKPGPGQICMKPGPQSRALCGAVCALTACCFYLYFLICFLF